VTGSQREDWDVYVTCQFGEGGGKPVRIDGAVVIAPPLVAKRIVLNVRRETVLSAVLPRGSCEAVNSTGAIRYSGQRGRRPNHEPGCHGPTFILLVSPPRSSNFGVSLSA
jgi:hypothetical protein